MKHAARWIRRGRTGGAGGKENGERSESHRMDAVCHARLGLVPDVPQD